MLPKKHLLGAQKRKRKQPDDQLIESQKGYYGVLFFLKVIILVLVYIVPR
jgi:hypothetical protein